MKSSNLKYLFTVVMSVVVALSFTACGTAAAPADTTNPDTTTGSTDATQAPAAGDVVAAYTFTNTGSVELCELYLSPVGTDSWGPDQLQAQTIAVGSKFVLKNIPAGSYDAKVVGCGGAGESIIQVDIRN